MEKIMGHKSLSFFLRPRDDGLERNERERFQKHLFEQLFQKLTMCERDDGPRRVKIERVNIDCNGLKRKRKAVRSKGRRWFDKSSSH